MPPKRNAYGDTGGKRVKVDGEPHLYVKDGLFLVIVGRPNNGGQHVESIGKINLAQARLERDRIVGEVKTKKRVKTSSASTVSVAMDWIAREAEMLAIGKLAQSTYNNYEGSLRIHILPFFAGRQIGSITADDIVAWHEWVMRGGERTIIWYNKEGEEKQRQTRIVKPPKTWSVRAHYIALRGLLGYATRLDMLPANPADKLEARERPRSGDHRVTFLDSREIQLFLDAAKNERTRLALAMAIFLGPRLGELRGLRWMDVDFEDGIVYVRGQADRKGKWTPVPKSAAGCREIVMPDGLASMLKAYKMKSKFSQPQDFILAGHYRKNGGSGSAPVSPRNLAQRGLEPAAHAIGRDDVTFHVLRHTFASIMISQGHDATYVAAQMGHEKPSVTLDIYSHLFNRVRHGGRHRDLMNSDFGHVFKTDDAPKGKLVAL